MKTVPAPPETCPWCRFRIKEGDSHANIEDEKMVCRVKLKVQTPQLLGRIDGITVEDKS